MRLDSVAGATVCIGAGLYLKVHANQNLTLPGEFGVNVCTNIVFKRTCRTVELTLLTFFFFHGPSMREPNWGEV